MKIPSNKISAVIKYFKEQLKDYYPYDEIQSFIWICFNHYLNLSPTDLIISQDKTMSESELLKFNFAVKDLKKNKPIQYILGETEFYGLKINVDPSVLIPRQETEELVDWIINDFKPTKEHLKIIDICTGSGCIAIALNKNLPGSDVKAVDISREAINTAKKNAALNNSEISFLNQDALLGIKTNDYFDIIVSNPPYVTNSEKKLMHNNVLSYEPHLALFIEDNDPLKFYKAIAKWALNHLNKKGKLYFEINELKSSELINLLELLGYKEIVVKKDLNEKFRMIRCMIK
ncbi:MAG: peptide chain release factor N(5)-glutamine methyltransferase [Bacteroidetes bacterium]|nr:peptide chain release factor N(5)-glutamine methyltransferase [Bacteroidota bacterium]HET6244278.1 peptide chain release factor N(5)-glutamine methyltransferase [Bacteroidia bacterium]